MQGRIMVETKKYRFTCLLREVQTLAILVCCLIKLRPPPTQMRKKWRLKLQWGAWGKKEISYSVHKTNLSTRKNPLLFLEYPILFKEVETLRRKMQNRRTSSFRENPSHDPQTKEGMRKRGRQGRGGEERRRGRSTGRRERARRGCRWQASRRERGRGTSTARTSRPPSPSLLSLSLISLSRFTSPHASFAAPLWALRNIRPPRPSWNRSLNF